MIQQSSNPLVGYWPGVFFQVHGFEFTVCWEKQNVRPNTGDLFYYGVSVTSDKKPQGLVNPTNSGARYRSRDLRSLGKAALSATRGRHEKIRVNRGSLWGRRWREVRRTYLRAADGGMRPQRCGQNLNYDVASKQPCSR